MYIPLQNCHLRCNMMIPKGMEWGSLSPVKPSKDFWAVGWWSEKNSKLPPNLQLASLGELRLVPHY